MKRKTLIKVSVFLTLIQVFAVGIFALVITSMAMQVITLPQRAVSEASDKVKEWIYGSKIDLSSIDFQSIADLWIIDYEWINPQNNQSVKGIPDNTISIMRQEELMIPPELLIAIASLKGKGNTFWIEDIASKLQPRNLKFQDIDGEIMLTDIQTYLGIYNLSYSDGKIDKVTFSDNSEILDKLLQELRLKKDKELILSIVKALDSGYGSLPDQESVEIVGSYFGWPLDKKYRISSPFGERYHPVDKKWKLHAGTDFAVPEGTKLYAAADGIIEKSTFSEAAGNYINIKHDNGYVTRYLHLIRRNAKVGERVKKGDLIGYSGSTGKVTGPHLHFEVRLPNGDPVDAESYLPKTY